jgi:hypothetical protein
VNFSANGVILTLPDDLASCGMEATEQGGVLIGLGNHVHHFTRPGPLDIRLPGMFMMLDDCHQDALSESGMSYLGAWHSHPCGTPSEHSTEDLLDWRGTAPLMFEAQPHLTHFYYPIVTGDRLRVWALDRGLTLTELHREEVAYGPYATPAG